MQFWGAAASPPPLHLAWPDLLVGTSVLRRICSRTELALGHRPPEVKRVIVSAMIVSATLSSSPCTSGATARRMEGLVEAPVSETI